MKKKPSKKTVMKISQAALATAGQKPVDARRKLTAPLLPPGVLPQGKRMAMDDNSGPTPWGWANTLQGGGVGCGLYFPGYPYLAELSQRPEYSGPIQVTAEEMTRKWFEFKSSADKKVADKIKKLTEWFVEMGLQDKFRRCTELDGFFGMAKLFVRMKGDKGHREEPLLISKETIPVGSVEGFRVIEAMWCTPQAWNANDPTADDFYKPTVWYVMGNPIHSSRLINFVSRELPDLLKPSYNFGGMSLTQLLETYVVQWLRTKNAVADLIHNFSIIALATDMQAILAEDDSGAELFNRIEMFIKNRDNKGLMTLNKDAEELTQIAVPLGTLDALQAQAQEHMSAISHLPFVKAFGITPKGLNASSEEEIQVFYDHINARQEIVYTRNLNDLSQIGQLHLFGEIDPGIQPQYVPLKELDGEALGRVRKGDAELAQTLIGAGVISPEEERERLAADPNSGYNNIDPSDVPTPPPVPGEEDAQGGGGDAE